MSCSDEIVVNFELFFEIVSLVFLQDLEFSHIGGLSYIIDIMLKY